MANYRKVLPVYDVTAGTLQGFSASGRAIAPRTAPATAPGFYRRFAKRAFDVSLVLLAAPVVLPVIAFLAMLVAIDGGNPFYLQERIGAGGRTFRMWKLRTMVPDAKAALDTLLARDETARIEWETTQKLKSDPRITRVGGFLRRSSLDELPQLWNVFKGDMSLVGPRPMMPEQQILYSGDSYYRLRPGITGPWQVSARNLSTFAERAEFDLDYDLNLSLPTDLRILSSTVRVILRATGH